MIPLKEAINIFEQYKIDWFRGTPYGNFNDHQFGFEKATSFGLGPTENGQPILGKTLLNYLNRRYLKKDNTYQPIIGGDLQLYGKENNPSIDGKAYNELEYVKIYLDCPEIDHDLVPLVGVSNWDSSQFFENYDYKTTYNPSTNYTVMGNKELNNIQYIDISVDKKEFKEFLDNLYKEL